MRRIPYLHILLFGLTFLSTLSVGALHEGVNIFAEPSKLYRGLPFSATLLVILSAHELSHYYYSRRHHVEATLPYFIPAPTLFGTFGAFIKMKSPITTRTALMEIGASGPIAGFIVSVMASAAGLAYSEVIMTTKLAEGSVMLGDPIIFKALSLLIIGPLPDTQDIVLHPVAFAGWIGFFVTSLNLIPVGQLDGGHIAYAVLGDVHEKLSKILIGVLAVLGAFVFEGWLVWAVLLVILGLRHPPIIHADIPLDPSRKRIGMISLAIFIITFMPVPITIL